ncbi:ABC transporter related protein [Spirochaeta thermophila DSM 6578]|uniref:ABC transporter related protein n=1 Tax=Winmispira thermophila (strain ATCC 700085 / DSM 6578 / Z-1203) TaxID=869211 RepID=G0GC09_WINT7|nr:ABC transporter ATP-binding protein [Spirochaeta thermophila]AEJ62020.1 ABC transporter related protein [Spirochaeta thermophila DSM 6578]
MAALLTVDGLKKRFGRVTALDGLSFSIDRGEIYALIGPNGAGKTTTLRILSTLLVPDEGGFTIDGIDGLAHPDEVRSRISYLAEESLAYKHMTGESYLRFMAGLYADSITQEEEFFARGCELSGLGERLKDKISTYSKGMTRKLLIARAVMMTPLLAILDEPTSGLDVENAVQVRTLIRSLTEEGITVLLSSHNMLEVEFLARRVGIIHRGRLLAEGTPQELKERSGAENLEQVFMEVTR